MGWEIRWSLIPLAITSFHFWYVSGEAGIWSIVLRMAVVVVSDPAGTWSANSHLHSFAVNRAMLIQCMNGTNAPAVSRKRNMSVSAARSPHGLPTPARVVASMAKYLAIRPNSRLCCYITGLADILSFQKTDQHGNRGIDDGFKVDAALAGVRAREVRLAGIVALRIGLRKHAGPDGSKRMYRQ